MMHIDVKLKEELIKTTDALRKKYKALKRGKEAYETQVEDALRPITTPLNKLVKKSNSKQEEEHEKNIFQSSTKKIEPVRKEEEFITPSPFISYPNTDNNNSTPRTHTEHSKTRKSLRINHRNFAEQLSHEEFSDIPKKYLDLFINNSNSIDNIYGIYLKNGKLYIGDGEFRVQGNDIHVKTKNFKGTHGLYELIFMKRPNEKIYNSEDLNNYKTILTDTNSHRDSHDPEKQVRGNRGAKYNIIKHLFANTTPSFGSGLMNLSNMKKDYIYWDDPNELVDRLKLLIGSQQAGNNNHSNEIVSIVEELKEKNIIV